MAPFSDSQFISSETYRRTVSRHLPLCPSFNRALHIHACMSLAQLMMNYERVDALVVVGCSVKRMHAKSEELSMLKESIGHLLASYIINGCRARNVTRIFNACKNST